MRNFALLLDETARSMSTPLLTGILVDLGKWRDWARERNDFAAAVMLGTAIHHASAEIARRAKENVTGLPLGRTQQEQQDWEDQETREGRFIV